jgi:hypothetical protein
MDDYNKIYYARDIGHNIIKSVTFLPAEKYDSDYIKFWEYLKSGPPETKRDQGE